jgi:hypothetical protein
MSNSPFFGAKVSRNDFYPGTEEILAASPAFSAELSAATGNYWGLPCSDHDGFVGTTGNPIVETVTNSSVALVIADISVTGRDRGDFQPSYGFRLPARLRAAASPSAWRSRRLCRGGPGHATPRCRSPGRRAPSA